MGVLLIGLHVFVGVTLIPDLALGPFGSVLAWAYLALSAVLMRYGVLVRGKGNAVLAWSGLLAMGIFSSLSIFSLLRAFVLAVASLAGWESARLEQGSAYAVIVAVVAVTLFGLLNARRTARVVERDIALRNLPAALDGFSIVQLSDIHVGPTIKRGYIDAIVRRANGLSPDLIVITGDLVDGSVADLRDDVAPLAQLSAQHGVYVVTGNHEYYSGADSWIAAFERLNMKVLLNRHVLLAHEGARLVLAGISDYSAELFNPGHRSDPHAALAGAPDDVPRTSPVQRRQWRRLGAICSCPAIRTAASSGRGCISCSGSNPGSRDCSASARCRSTSAVAPVTGARRCASAPRRRSPVFA